VHVQAALNTQVAAMVRSPFRASFLSFCIGAVVMTVAALLSLVAVRYARRCACLL
jgi:uncharacterized membrane protein YdcZ (DUF606 family)